MKSYNEVDDEGRMKLHSHVRVISTIRFRPKIALL